MKAIGGSGDVPTNAMYPHETFEAIHTRTERLDRIYRADAKEHEVVWRAVVDQAALCGHTSCLGSKRTQASASKKDDLVSLLSTLGTHAARHL